MNAYLTVGDSYFYVKRQLIFLGAGLLGALGIMKLPPSTLRLLSWFGVGLAAILLILTYTPLGISVNGNRNWLYLGSSLFSIQPAEFAKLAMIVWELICWPASIACWTSRSTCWCPSCR